ncbi:hypothetical protein C8R43DRAFT_961723 [Mycena crocata]|nr:hypothetical protein C8R43DRAFT_961723 [Mycena crocata]
MAPPRWSTVDQEIYLSERLPAFLTHRADGKTYKFWHVFFEDWFDKWPEQAITIESKKKITSESMAPRTWHTPEQRLYFMEQMPAFIQRRSQGKLYKFWGPMYEGWFHKWPEQAVLGMPLPSATGDAPNLSVMQLKTLGEAIEVKKKKILNYFNNNKNHLQPGAAKHAKSDLALGRMLFKAKPTRRRVHKPIEVFQLRNNDQIREECRLEGHDELNEEVMSKAVDNWVDEDDDEQVARVREAAAARLRIRNRVVNALFADATVEELAAIAEVVENEKTSGKVNDQEDNGDGSMRTPAEYQASIDESWEVVKMVHRALGRMTGWYGMTMWGGPNPRIGGELSMKCVSFGISPSGNDFEASHATFEKSVALPFQIFLKRCFSPQVRLERSALGAPGEADATDELDPAFRIHAPEPEAESTKPKVKAPKRIRKPKKKTVDKPVPSNGSPAPGAPVQVPAVPFAVPVQVPVPTLAHRHPSLDSTSVVTPSSAADTITPSAATMSQGFATTAFVGNNMQTLEESSAVSGRFGMDVYMSEVGQTNDDFSMGYGSDYDLGMPPLPSGEQMDWASSPTEILGTGYGLSLPSARTEDEYTLHLPAAPTIPKARPCFQGAEYPLNRQPSPTANYAGGFRLPEPSSDTTAHTTVSPARFRRVNPSSTSPQSAFSFSSTSTPAPLQPVSSFSLTPPQPALYSSSAPVIPQLPSPLTVPHPTLSSTSTQPTVASEPEHPIYAVSRPSANIPQSAGEKKGRATGKNKLPAKKRTAPGAEAETAAAAAGKVAAKKRGRKPKGGDGVDAQDLAGNLDNALAGVLGDASNSVSSVLVYTSTNNSRIYARRAREAEEARRAIEDAARTADLAEKARVFNPDGPTDLVILPPPPGREKRARKAATHPDGSHVTLVPKVTRAQQLEHRNKNSENALLARTGRLPGAIATTISKKK